jgi:hypothetical protein
MANARKLSKSYTNYKADPLIDTADGVTKDHMTVVPPLKS